MLFLTYILLLGSAYASGPGDAGGGGSFVRCSNQQSWRLLDRVNRNPELLTGISKKVISEKKEEGKELQRINTSELPAFSRATEMLDRWQDDSPQLVKMIDQAMRNVPYFFVNRGLSLSEQFTLANEAKAKCENLEVKTAIRFLPKYGSFISNPLWSSADLDTQAGLLIHEALRQVQITYEFDIKNEDLENITASLVDGLPDPDRRLQESSSVKGMLKNYFSGWSMYRALGGKSKGQQPSCAPSAEQPMSLDFCIFALAVNFHLDLSSTVDAAQKNRVLAASDEEILGELKRRHVFEE